MLNKFIIIFYKARTDIPTERELLKEISIIFYKNTVKIFMQNLKIQLFNHQKYFMLRNMLNKINLYQTK